MTALLHLLLPPARPNTFGPWNGERRSQAVEQTQGVHVGCPRFADVAFQFTVEIHLHHGKVSTWF